MFKRKGIVLTLTVVLVFALTLSACAGWFGSDDEEENKTYTAKFALEEIEGSVQHQWAKEFKKRVEKKTDGNIKIQIYPYGTLGSSEDITESTQNGVVQMAFSSPGHLGSSIPEIRIFSTHFLWSDDVDANKEVMKDSEAIYTDLAKEFKKQNLKLLEVNTEGWQVWTANKEIRKPADFKGIKMRVMGSPMLIKQYNEYGANPVQIAYSEIYSSLQLGMIDAQVQPIFATQEMKFYEQQDYLIWGKHLPFTTTVVSNQDWFKSLPEKYQKVITETSKDMVDYITKVEREFNEKRLEKIKKAKPSINTIRLTEEERQAFKDKVMSFRESDKYKELIGGDNGMKILNKLKKEIKAAE